MFETKGEAPPYYLDCRPIVAGLIERAPGARSLICEEGSQTPVTFADEEAAASFLRSHVPVAERRQYEWILVSADILADEGHTIDNQPEGVSNGRSN